MHPVCCGCEGRLIVPRIVLTPYCNRSKEKEHPAVAVYHLHTAKRTSAAKAAARVVFYGTAKAVPLRFVAGKAAGLES